MNASSKLSLEAPSHVNKIVQAENGQKVDDFEPIYLGKYRFVVFEHNINRLYVDNVRLPQLEYYFSSFFLLFFFFLFLLRLSTFKPLNALYSKFERLKITERTSVGIKLGVPNWMDPFQSGRPKF